MDTKNRVKGFNINLEFEYSNDVLVEKFLTGSEAALGKKDFSQPLKILNKHWVETVADLRLLVQEGQLRSIGLPIRLCGWIETEISKISKVVDLPPSISPDEVKVVVFEDTPHPAQDFRVFRYESDFDVNGILYWIGTRGGVSPWQNPAELGFVRITTSGLMENSQPASCFVGRETVRGVTTAMEKAWIAIDLIDKWVKLSHYTLRHYDSWDTEALRDWHLEGSNDSTNWTLLREHKSDGALRTKGGTATWTITDVGTFFRVFRVIMTGPNSNNHAYLACSGVELYGELTLSPAILDSSISMVSRVTPKESQFKLNEEKEVPAGLGEYIYHHDLDSNGIIFNIGTHGGQRSWINPGEAGYLVVTASSVMTDSVSINYVVGRDVVRCVTKPQPSSWIAIDLVDKVVIPTHYTLRHYSSWDTEALRSWRFEGSNDGVAWTLLMEHKNDQSLRSKGQTYTWTLPKRKEHFRHFRIFQTGENSNNHHYLSLSGFELYGKLLQADTLAPYVFGSLPKTQQQTEFSYTGDFDGRGVIHWLGTNYGTEPWRNPVSRNLVAVRASSLANDSHPAHCVVGQEVVRCVTKPEENSWFVVDLLGRLLVPTHYTLRHYSSWDTEALRNWLFQGSVDGNSWTHLREHKDDASLATKGATHTWTLNTTQRFNMFRIVQTGPNSNNHHYLALSGFEIYGVLHGAPAIGKKRSDSSVARSLSSSFSDSVSDEKKASSQTLTSPISGALRATEMVWDTNAKGPSIEVYGKTAVNVGSQDKWQMVRSVRSFSSGRHLIALKVDLDPQTSNTWRFIVGVVPGAVDAAGSTQWVGSKGSWGYISGTGGKCHQKAISVPYGAKFGVGDVVGIGLDFVAGTVEFYKNGVGQGVAFNKIVGPVFIAASLTGTNSSLSFCDWVDSMGVPGVVPDVGSVEVEDVKGSVSGSGVSGGASPADSELSGNWGTWDSENKSKFLVIDNKLGLVKNTGSSDKWQSARSVQAWETGICEFSVEIVNSPDTPNSWRLIVGVVPPTFTCSGSKQWVGAGGSWGFIAGTGGKCFNLPVSLAYGEPWGQTGDIMGVRLDFTAGTIEFLKNGISQGVAFTTLKGPVHAAVSLTATGSAARIRLNSVS